MARDEEEPPALDVEPPALVIEPPLLNSASPWATTLRDLETLYRCASTGAVTTRTSLLGGFRHDPAEHQHVFFDAASHGVAQDAPTRPLIPNASLNSLGYSPVPLNGYLDMIKAIDASAEPAVARRRSGGKGFIVSVTGSPADVAECYRRVASAQRLVSVPLAVEINLSCPNIPNRPPPAYSPADLAAYLEALAGLVTRRNEEQQQPAAAGAAISATDTPLPRVPFGLKTPPYTHSTEFATLVGALAASAAASPTGRCPVSFLTATNTLGGCLVLGPPPPPPPPTPPAPAGECAPLEGAEPCVAAPRLPGLGLGGMAGAPLHPLALGNVATLRRMLDANSRQLGHIRVVGVGGVLDGDGYRRMKAAGAYAVGVATGLGLRGVDVFDEICDGDIKKLAS